MPGEKGLSQREHEVLGIGLTCLEHAVCASLRFSVSAKTADILISKALLNSALNSSAMERKADLYCSVPGYRLRDDG